VIQELFRVLCWLARTYTQDPAALPASGLAFDAALIPRPDHDVVRKTQAKLKALAEVLAARDAVA
jgi:type I restriction enzyme R subunit